MPFERTVKVRRKFHKRALTQHFNRQVWGKSQVTWKGWKMCRSCKRPWVSDPGVLLIFTWWQVQNVTLRPVARCHTYSYHDDFAAVASSQRRWKISCKLNSPKHHAVTMESSRALELAERVRIWLLGNGCGIHDNRDVFLKEMFIADGQIEVSSGFSSQLKK